ncbi:MAG: type 1 glutamine amidotransferase [Sulfitobacter sp.]|nr:type 1 glutamine amidotransferase [Sulfitobacter sp.]
MRLAILITNTDDSAFARARPDDGEKFTQLIHEVRPDWVCVPFWVCRDEFPEDVMSFDGVLITGSPASVTEGAPWMLHLEGLIREMIAARLPIFAVCFGHQIVAKALGAKIVSNPQGWGHGRMEIERVGRTPWSGEAQRLSLYGSHIEQVEAAPSGARVVFRGAGLPVAGFTLGDSLATVQHHPEMTHAFITDLVEHYADEVGKAVTERARRSLQKRADRETFAEEIAGFFEHAVAYVSRERAEV